MLTAENINKLLNMRQIVNEYSQSIVDIGKTSELVSKLKSDLSTIGISTGTDKNSIDVFNIGMCTCEIDECFEVRLKPEYEHTGIHLCDGCSGRTNMKCRDLVCGITPHQIMSQFSPFLSYEDSQVIRKQLNESNRTGVIPPVIVTPLEYIFFGNFENHSPTRCNGRFVKVKEPRFDVMWRTERHWAIGDEVEHMINVKMGLSQ